MKRLTENRHYLAILAGGGLVAVVMIGGGVEPVFDSADNFVILAKDQITIGSDISLSSGNMGVNDSRGRITIGAKSSINGDVYADTVIFGAQNTVNGSVTAKRPTTAHGTEILGELSTAFSAPLVSPFPSVPDFAVGTQNLTIRSNTEETIAPGGYRNINAGSNNTLTFTGGTYNIYRLTVGSNTTLVFQAPTTLNIKTAAVFLGSKAVFSPISTLNLDDIKINVKGKTLTFGSDSFVSGIVTAPDANVTIGSKTTFRGQIVGQRIVVGSGVILSRSEDFEIESDPSMAIVDPADGTRYILNEVIVDFVTEAHFQDAQEVANVVNGTIAAYIPSANAYKFIVPATSISELEQIIETINDLVNPKVEGVFQNFIFELIP